MKTNSRLLKLVRTSFRPQKKLRRFALCEIDTQVPKVLFIVPVYRYFPAIIHSLRMQTYQNWRLLLIHDGPPPYQYDEEIQQLKDSRIQIVYAPRHEGNWGHVQRQRGLDIARKKNWSDTIVITNADNYYLPEFTESMLMNLTSDAVAVYCNMLHRTHERKPVPSAIKHGCIDIGCLMMVREAALAVNWNSTNYDADWSYIKQVVQIYGEERISKNEKYLFIHN